MSPSLVEPSRHVRDHFAQVIERDQPTVITRNGREIAAVVPIADWRRYEELANREQSRLTAQWRNELYLPRRSFVEDLRDFVDDLEEDPVAS